MSDKIGVEMHIEGNRFWFERDKGFELIELDDSVEPHRIDFWEGGTAVTGIYRVEGETIALCTAPPGFSRPTDFEPAFLSREIRTLAVRKSQPPEAVPSAAPPDQERR